MESKPYDQELRRRISEVCSDYCQYSPTSNNQENQIFLPDNFHQEDIKYLIEAEFPEFI